MKLQNIQGVNFAPRAMFTKTNATTSNPLAQNQNIGLPSLAVSNAIKASHPSLASTVSFTASLAQDLEHYTHKMFTAGGEAVGEATEVSRYLFESQDDRVAKNDTKKSDLKVGDRWIRAQARAMGDNTIPGTQDQKLEYFVKGPDAKNADDKSEAAVQTIQITTTPVNVRGVGSTEEVHLVNTKGNKGNNFVTTVEDKQMVLMTNSGTITKKDSSNGMLKIEATQIDPITKKENGYKPFLTKMDKVHLYTPTESVGNGTEIVIGMEDGRFVNEIKASIAEFVQKVNDGEIVLKPFVAAPNAKDTQLIMLAGGFGSRAEYTNASSRGILHGDKDGAISTKGVFRTATGLTPMETTFVTLHNAGLLDCSKGKLSLSGDNANIKFYLNKTGINKGNGGYTNDLQEVMNRPDRKSVMIFPNDSMSRMTNAVTEANKIMATGKAAVVMIAKEVSAEDAKGNFGIMKLGKDNEILEFAEKPKEIPDGYVVNPNAPSADQKCLTNTFQFAVSKEAFAVLDQIEPYFSKSSKAKETRDWSKQYIPILKTLSQVDNYDEIRKILAPVLGEGSSYLDDTVISKCKAILGNQKIYAVPTDEPWADCGSLNALYKTTMDIASGTFKLEDFERKHTLDCVDTRTGLVATTPELKAQVEAKYDINGQIMAVEQARKISDDEIKDIPVTINR